MAYNEKLADRTREIISRTHFRKGTNESFVG
jgi:hypothetical protein